MPGAGPARQSIARHGGIIVCRNIAEAIALANNAASEHVVVGNESLARRIVNAGAMFVGGWTAQVAGDYAIGSNHVLPTAGRGALSWRIERRGFREAGVGAASDEART